MMNKCMLSFAMLTSLVVVCGCGDAGSNQNVGENADAKAMADYEASVKASEEAMNQAPPAP